MYESRFRNIAIEHPFYEPTDVENQAQFAELMAKYTKEEMDKINKSESKNAGLWYPEDYDKDYDRTLSYFANTDFWESNVGGLSQSGVFMSKLGIKPNEALNALLQGPTISECASSLMACQHKALERIIGTEKFNQIFGDNALNPFMLTGFLYAGGNNKDKFTDILLQNKINDKAYNPLYAMHDHPEIKDEKDVQVGDILSFSNAALYFEKHPRGAYQWYNVICVGKNEKVENLYTAFGGKDFIKPLTKNEICDIMLAGYNAPQTKQDIKYFTDTNKENSFGDAILDKETAIKGGLGTIANVIRPNLQKLRENFTEKKFTPWHDRRIENIKEDDLGKKGKFNEISTIQTENQNSTFATYKVENDEQRKMAENAKKFAQAIVFPIDETPNIFIMSGNAGIGKTHLANSIANYVASQGKSVSYLNPKSLKEMIDKTHNDPTDEDIKNWFSGSNLIVFDDCNFDDLYNTSGRFITKLTAFAVKNNISMLFTSNVAIDLKKVISKSEVAIPPESNLNFNHLNLSDIKLESKRTHWKNEIVGARNPINAIANYKGKNASGLMIENSDFNLEKIKSKMLEENQNLKIRISGTPTKTEMKWSNYHKKQIPVDGIINDMFIKLEDHGKYNAFIIKVTDKDEMEQFLHLISHVHDTSSRVILLVENKAKFDALLGEQFNKFMSSFKTEEKKLRDRIRCIVAGENEIENVIQNNKIKPQETVDLQSIIQDAFGNGISSSDREISELIPYVNPYKNNLYVDTSVVNCGCGITNNDYKIIINENNTATISRNNDRFFGGFWQSQIDDINKKLNKNGYEMVKSVNKDEYTIIQKERMIER